MSFSQTQLDALTTSSSSQRGRAVQRATELSPIKETAMTTTNLSRENSLGTLSPVDVPISQLPVVELSADHIRRCSELANDRNESYHQIDGGTVYGSNDSLTSHETGIIGEMAVAEAYAADIDTTTYAFGDGGIDTELWGTSVDVKSTTTRKMTYPQLLVCDTNELAADLYFQTHIQEWGSDGAEVRILGYATRAQVDAKKPIPHPGETKNHVVEPEEMTLPPLMNVCHG